MRAWLFRKLLNYAGEHTPAVVQRIQLQILANVTADAFRAKPPQLRQKSADEALAVYAAFTKSCMESGPADSARLYRLAYDLGRRLRKITGFSEQDDLQRLVFLLYRNIGITMEGRLPGSVTVSGCYFSHVYSPEQCRIISAMDSGVVAGLCGGGQLVFTKRLTEGDGHCTAHLERG